ncbi:MucR family transcriptional regulator, partial [Methylobacterium sp. E-065]|uniref:MucR family transcriptional regulator n=1 Tax=Methylobacterium sp. E-065 TaxID=2836583 RepID=UPI001FBAFDD6
MDLTTTIVAAYVSNNSVRPGDLPDLLSGVHTALAGLSQGAAPAAPMVDKQTPAQIRKSITPDALIS